MSGFRVDGSRAVTVSETNRQTEGHFPSREFDDMFMHCEGMFSYRITIVQTV